MATVHVTGVFGHQERRLSNTLSIVETFENRDVSYSCGRAKTEVFKYDDALPRFRARSSVHTIRKRFVWAQIEEIIRFRKYPATCGQSNRIQKRYVWTQMFFQRRRKKFLFSKIPGNVWTRSRPSNKRD